MCRAQAEGAEFLPGLKAGQWGCAQRWDGVESWSRRGWQRPVVQADLCRILVKEFSREVVLSNVCL
jgi:hypothetical protein